MNNSQDSTLPVSPASPRPQSRRWLRTLFLSAVLLGSGAAIGSGLTMIVLTRGLHFGIRHPELFPARATQRLRSYLDLSDEQATRVESILRQHQQQLQHIRREVQPRVEEHLDQIRDEISGVLTPEQACKWQKWLAAKREAWLPPPPAASEGS